MKRNQLKNRNKISRFIDLFTSNSIVENLRQELSHVEFIEGKPSMDAMVQYETEKADMSLAFITCGHPMMVDELRVAVKKNLDNTPHRVDFFEQLQGWS